MTRGCSRLAAACSALSLPRRSSERGVEILACAVGGCNSGPTLVAKTNTLSGTTGGIAAMTLDAHYVYWVLGQGFVARAPKPM